tara:strand:- start:5761 stop:6267 length:507 start_codon:yes stop_codon:yes gene_type:complete
MLGARVKKVVIFGNSGSGKSTLAKQLSDSEGLAHFDLDTIAWQPVSPPVRRSIEESTRAIESFMESSDGWVIEGCYSDLLAVVIPCSTEIIFLNLPVEDCIDNARNRPWEPHKYPSREEQDANLAMLIDWIAQYPHRKDTFSQASHEQLFADYDGKKTIHTTNQRPRS